MAVIATAEVRIVADTSRFVQQLRRQLQGAWAPVGRDATRAIRQSLDQSLTQQIVASVRRAANVSGRSFGSELVRAIGRNLGPLRSLANEVGGFYADLGRVALPGIRTFTNAVRREAADLVAVYRDTGQRIGAALQPAFRNFAARALQAGNAARGAFRNLGADLGDAFADLGDRAAVGFANIGSALRYAFNNAYDAVSRRTLLFNAELIRHWTTGARFVEQDTQSIFTRMWRGIADMGLFQVGIITREWAQRIRGVVTGLPAGLTQSFREVGQAAQNSASAITRVFNRAAAAVGARFSTIGDAIAASARRGANGFMNAFTPISSRLSRWFQAIPWPSLGRAAGDAAGTGLARSLGQQVQRRIGQIGRNLGIRLGRSISAGAIGGLRALGQGLAAISLRPLQGLAGLLANASSEMLSMAAIGVVLVGLIESLSGALFALPAAIGVVGAAVATVAVAFNGFGGALSAAWDDLEAFEESLDGLAPAAQAVAREFRALTPALTDIRVDVQQALFEQLDGTLTAVANNLMGPLRTGLTSAAAAFGGIITEIGEFLSQAATADTVAATFETLTSIFDALGQSTQPFLEAMRLLTDTFLPRIAEAAGPLAEMGERFRDWTEEVVASGQAMEAFELALDVFGELASVALDLGGIFQAMFSAAQLAGVDALGAIAAVLDNLRETMESTAGQFALASVFEALGETVSALAPVFGTLLLQLGVIAPVVADLAEALGPSLSVVLENLGQALLGLGEGAVPLFEGIAAAAETIAPALVPLGAAIGDILSAIAPILPVIGQLIAIVVELGAEILTVLASAIAPIVTALADSLAPILPDIADLFSRLVQAVAPLVQALGEGLASVISTLLPPILELVLVLADALMPIFEAIVPVLTPILDIFFQLVNIIGSLLVPVVALLLPIIEALAPLFELVGVVLAPLLELLTAILEPITLLIGIIADLLTPVIEFLAEVIGAIISTALTPLTAIFTFLGELLAEHVIPWFEQSAAILQLFWTTAIEPLIDWIGRLTSNISDKFGTIRDAVSTLAGFWRGQFDQMLNVLDVIVSAVRTAATSVADYFSDLWDRVVEIWNGITSAIQIAVDLIDNLISNAVGSIGDAVSSISSLGDLLPFADGGIVTSPTAALIGEAGKEVVIPLTRPTRAVELAEQSGLISLLAAQGAINGAGEGNGSNLPPVEMHVHTQSVDPEQVARRAVRIIERRLGGRGLERIS